MPILLQYLYAIGTFQGLLLAGLLMFSSRTTSASRILGVWCLFLALSFLDRFIFMDGNINAFSVFIGFSFFLPACYGALLYLYCRNAITGQSISIKDGWHFLPILSCYLLNVDFYFLTATSKLQAVYGGPREDITILISNWILYLQAFAYFAISTRLIRRYQREAKQTLSNFNPDIFAWLWKLLIVDLVIWTLKLSTNFAHTMHTFAFISDLLIILLIYIIAMAQWKNPNLFQIPQLNARNQQQENFSGSGEEDPTTKKQRIGSLDASTRANLLGTVRQHMHSQQTYLDNQLTLTSLSSAIGVSTHHLSEVLNLQEGKNFYQFVNRYRIDFICDKLKQQPNLKMLDLALTAGFSSKSTFNAVFKQITGLTPTQYRTQLT